MSLSGVSKGDLDLLVSDIAPWAIEVGDHHELNGRPDTIVISNDTEHSISVISIYSAWWGGVVRRDTRIREL
jgi:hypothetical protein